jgi:hypothetical protein
MDHNSLRWTLAVICGAMAIAANIPWVRIVDRLSRFMQHARSRAMTGRGAISKRVGAPTTRAHALLASKVRPK